MAFSKFTGVERAEVLTPQQHQAAQDQLRSMGKTSARGLTDDERQRLSDAVDKSE